MVTTSFDLDLRGELATILSDGTRKYLPADPGAGHEQAGTWYSALADVVGSPHSLVSSAGVQGSITRWDPYGAPRPGSSAAVGIGYAAEWRDPAGLIDLRARAYDPALGRLVSRDGFAGVLPLPQTANRYSYARNGPYRYGDPSGRFAAALYANGPLLLSMAVQSLPVVGDAYSALTGCIGYDPIAGVALSEVERAAAIASAFVVGGGFHLLGRMAGAVPNASRLGRAGDGFADVGAAARGVPLGGGGGATRSLTGADSASPAFRLPTGLGAGRHQIFDRVERAVTHHGGVPVSGGYSFTTRRAARQAASEIAGDLGSAAQAIRASEFEGGPFWMRDSSRVIGRRSSDQTRGWRDDFLGHKFRDGTELGPHVKVFFDGIDGLPHLFYGGPPT